MEQAPDLNDAVARVKAFLSGMTADDLDVIVAFVNDFPTSD
jgi:hypothetical protein